MTSRPRSRSSLADHFARFEPLARSAERLAARGRIDEAVAVAQIASHSAWQHHTGVFARPSLEAVIAGCAAELRPQQPILESQRAGWPARVVHVLTETSHVGGHTRVAWRWIARDSGRRHDVVVTGQKAPETPALLREAALSCGGRVDVLAPNRRVARRAAQLRELAGPADLVVLHIHPFDALPLLAFGARGSGPRVALFNHADHTFWLGASTCDAVVSMRASGGELTVARRGVENERNLFLPLPIDAPPRTRSRAAAKALLGIEAGATLCVTIASPHKYGNGATDPMVDAVLPVLRANPKACLVAVGPRDEGNWREARQATLGRVRALGFLEDLSVVHEAADVCIDSFPINSITSRLECGIYGNPLIGYSPHPAGAEVLRSPVPEGTMIRVFELDEFRARLADLIRDPDGRHELGRRTAAEIRSTNGAPAWNVALLELYRSIAELVPGAASEVDPAPHREVIDEAVCGLEFPAPHPLQRIARKHLGEMSNPRRARLLLGELRGMVPQEARLYLTDSQRARWRRLKRSSRASRRDP